jgi:hypothetical protein
MFHHSRQTLTHTIALELRRLRYGRPRQKVFCVGFQKTGTTSLQYALSLMGYRVAGYFSMADFSSPEEMRDRALEMALRFDAFGDNPWAVLFRDLDAAFPGSKFILTTRDPDRWYASACKHFGGRDSRMREWIYGAGSPESNRGAYVERMTRHVAEVRAYFADRPRDFMEFDAAQGEGWDKLCGFLGKPVPRRDFPRLNTATMRRF